MRAAALLVAVVIAYSYSLSTLIRGIGLQTPLAYLALVPVISLVLAWVRLAREPAPLPIHDRQVDYIIGITLLVVACAVALLAPITLSTAFWLNRYDLLGLPFFVSGLVLIWLLNVVRIEAIFLVGSRFGQAAALDVLHPVAGLIVFNLGVLVMLLATEKLGLHFIGLAPRPDGALRTPPAVATVRRLAILVAAIALALGATNVTYARYETIAGSLGQAKLVPFDIRNAQVANWTLSYVAQFDQGRQFFGPKSTWDRILYSSTPEATLRSSLPVYIDVISTDDPGTLAAYGLQDCYQFHGYRIETTTSVDLGSGIGANLLDYHNPKVGNDWSALWWEWPFSDGTKTWYERIVIFMAGGLTATFAGVEPTAQISGATRFASTDRFLYSLAQQLVHAELHRSTVTQ